MGPRHIIPILPFMSIGLIFFLEKFKGNSLAKSIFKILFMFSFLMMLFGTAVDPRLPPAGIEVNTFILMRLLFGTYAPNFTFFYHSINLGTLFYSFCMPYLINASFILTLVPLLFFLLLGVNTLMKNNTKLYEKKYSKIFPVLLIIFLRPSFMGLLLIHI